MTSLWRISNHCDLSGLGGEKSDGRWHTAGRGKRIVYLSEHPAVALLETLANLKANPAVFPDRYQLLQVTVEQRVLDAARLITGKSGYVIDRLAPLSVTQKEGDNWLKLGDSVLLAVPSFPSPYSANYLFNPRHPDASGLKIEACRWIEYDKRLFHVHE